MKTKGRRKKLSKASLCFSVYMNLTFPTMSRCPWLAARCRGVSSPRFMTLMRAPLMMSMSTTLERPSLHAQWRGLKPWSSLQQERNIYIQHRFHKKPSAEQGLRITAGQAGKVTKGRKTYSRNVSPSGIHIHSHMFSTAQILWYNWNKAK